MKRGRKRKEGKAQRGRRRRRREPGRTLLSDQAVEVTDTSDTRLIYRTRRVVSSWRLAEGGARGGHPLRPLRQVLERGRGAAPPYRLRGGRPLAPRGPTFVQHRAALGCETLGFARRDGTPRIHRAIAFHRVERKKTLRFPFRRTRDITVSSSGRGRGRGRGPGTGEGRGQGEPGSLGRRGQ